VIEGIRMTARSSIGGNRATRVLVAAQVALAVTLLIVAGLATRTLRAVESLEPGFEIDNVLTAVVTLPENTSPAAAAQWSEQALMQISRIPGVSHAGVSSRLPFAGSRWNPNRGIVIQGDAETSNEESRWAVDYAVSAGLLESLRVPLREGRLFNAGDGEAAPLAAIVSETMARRFWGERSPLGARLRQGDEPDGVWRTVVGVVGDIRNDDADQPPLPYLYLPFAQQPARTMTFAMRTSAEPSTFVDALRSAIGAVDPDQPLYDVRSMREIWERDLQGTHILVQVMAALAIVALGLAGVGVWGVTAQSVGQRTREIGVRLAIGATAGQVGLLVVRQGFVPIGSGLAIGLLAGLGLGQIMRSILFRVTPTDPLTVGSTLALLLAVGLAATVGPALRAARLDPLAALRND
jgi:putative ABC transport system permease protein